MQGLQIKIKEVPSSVNPTPRPSTSGGRPGTAAATTSAEWSFTGAPEVIDIDTEFENIYGSVLSAADIEKVSGGTPIEDITDLSLVLDTSQKSVSGLGAMVPQLRTLCLDHSVISSIRDLGIELRNLTTVSMNDCGINELDGVAAMINIKVLSLRNNNISDVSPLAMHDHLESLDLHGNRIFDISAGDTISSCPKLTQLTLSKNPIERAPQYASVICALVPQLLVLDSYKVTEEIRGKVSNAMILDASAAMNQIREEIEDEERLEMCIMEGEDGPISTLASQNSFSNTKVESSAEAGSAVVGVEPDTGSELTHGSDVVLAGGVAAAMRKRRSNRSVGNSCDSDESSSKVLGTLDSMKSEMSVPQNEVGPVGGSSGFLQEGDLTVSVLGHQPRPGTSGKQRPSSSSPRPSTSKRRTNLATENETSEIQLPTLSASPTAAERKEKKRLNSRGNISVDTGNSASNAHFPSTTESFGRVSTSGGRPPRSPLLGSSTPRQGSPYQHNETRPSTTLSMGRPLTSYSSYSDDGGENLSELAISAPSAPFKVSVPLAMRDDDLVALRSRLAPPTAGDSDDEGGTDDHDTVLSGNSHSTKSSSTKTREPPLRISTTREVTSQAALLDLNEYESAKSSTETSSRNNESSISKNRSQVKGIALLKPTHTPSIVHRDVVMRRNNRSNENGSDSDGEDDDEEILVNHQSRHDLINRGKHVSVNSPSSSSRGAKLGADLMAQMAGNGKLGAAAALATENVSQSRGEAGRSDTGLLKPPIIPPGQTLSSIAGRSLGFDLSGSLAAINQWVEDMDTGGESSGEESEDAVDLKSRPLLSFGLEHSSRFSLNEEKSKTTVPPKSSSNITLKDEKSDTSSHGSRSYNSSTREILSRQKILSMCTGKDERDADDSSLDNDILFIDVKNNPSSHPSRNENFSNKHMGGSVENSVESLRKRKHSSAPYEAHRSNNGAQSAVMPHLTNHKTTNITKYSDAVADSTLKLSSRTNLGSVDSDDDEGDLNDLYAENMRLTMSASTDLALATSVSPRNSMQQKQVSQKALDKSSRCESDEFGLSVRHENVFESSNKNIHYTKKPSETDRTSDKKSVPGSRNSTGNGSELSDNELVEMLNRPPKTTFALRTKSNFQDFFRGMESARMRMLLERAYEGESDEVKRKHKVERRMDLLKDVLL